MAAVGVAAGIESDTSTRANTLKRRVKRNTAWDIAHGYGKSEWVFAHGSDWQSKFAKKFEVHKS